MAKFEVCIEEVYRSHYEVEAEDEEAIKKQISKYKRLYGKSGVRFDYGEFVGLARSIFQIRKIP